VWVVAIQAVALITPVVQAHLVVREVVAQVIRVAHRITAQEVAAVQAIRVVHRIIAQEVAAVQVTRVVPQITVQEVVVRVIPVVLQDQVQVQEVAVDHRLPLIQEVDKQKTYKKRASDKLALFLVI